jgi:hypothetical protein
LAPTGIVDPTGLASPFDPNTGKPQLGTPRPDEGGGSAGPICPIPGGVSANQARGSKWWNYQGPAGDGLSDFKKFVGDNYKDLGGGRYTGIGPNGESVNYYPSATSTGGPTIKITPQGGASAGMSGYKIRF